MDDDEGEGDDDEGSNGEGERGWVRCARSRQRRGCTGGQRRASEEVQQRRILFRGLGCRGGSLEARLLSLLSLLFLLFLLSENDELGEVDEKGLELFLFCCCDFGRFRLRRRRAGGCGPVC